MEVDERDRQKEREELEEIRKKLLDDGHPDPEAEMERVCESTTVNTRHHHGRVPARAVASLHHHVHGRQHASRGLQSDRWNRFVAVIFARKEIFSTLYLGKSLGKQDHYDLRG